MVQRQLYMVVHTAPGRRPPDVGPWANFGKSSLLFSSCAAVQSHCRQFLAVCFVTAPTVRRTVTDHVSGVETETGTPGQLFPVCLRGRGGCALVAASGR